MYFTHRMKTISLYVDEERYAELKALAKRRELPVAELLRDAMEEYLERSRDSGSLVALEAHDSGRRRGRSARHGLLDEMRRR